ncbi:hypothetical protein [Rheinheimera soli]|uniref:Drug/metabolite transporter (DMT)-like permease n=1 Tax=Rheinheimera soli TaxID=443616 RepID=A0ABU1W5K8_9GAMM|nr:hypothetical protein [Rheinheimera soli]MDR7123115.1 drug/metabolite transporter (DMT)-like permease [Rheinheimera soli]
MRKLLDLLRSLFGSYGLFEIIVSMLFFGLCLYFNFVFIEEVLKGKSPDEQTKFMVLFFNMMMTVIIALPLISKLLSKISDNKFSEFIDLPTKDNKFTFTSISGFLSDQALASFLATVLIFTGKEALGEYGGWLAAGYMFFLFAAAIILATISLVRFIFHFTKYHWAYYALAAMLSSSVMFAFFNVGLRLGA